MWKLYRRLDDSPAVTLASLSPYWPCSSRPNGVSRFVCPGPVDRIVGCCGVLPCGRGSGRRTCSRTWGSSGVLVAQPHALAPASEAHRARYGRDKRERGQPQASAALHGPGHSVRTGRCPGAMAANAGQIPHAMATDQQSTQESWEPARKWRGPVGSRYRSLHAMAASRARDLGAWWK